MSPELVRGESHRIDGRSDIWSLGVILYLMLTGQKPFSGETRAELFDEIKHREPRPPRQIRPNLPSELERICLKCLAKPLNDRYATAIDVARDLRAWLQDSRSAGSSDSGFASDVPVVPKGLRSFDGEDADFYMQLVPGPRGRQGFPDIVRSWKSRIERKGNLAEPVSLLYGPSGCGKSSFVKAGLVPHLAPFVRVVQIEATHADTEVRLIKALRAPFRDIPTELTLPEVFHSLREGEWSSADQRILIVIDQFEQWLHNRSGYFNTELVEALRHCDGNQLQCLLLVRDDFWLATSRFLKALEIDLVEGKNASLIDLFDKPHAHKVLTLYGQGYGRLGSKLDEAEEEFVRLAVHELAEDDRVICVRLSLFAEMFKGKPWTPASLRKMGGAAGVGVAFLEETFSARNAPPEHRLHEPAARAVLGALLPDTSVDIRGNMRSRQELLHISGYAGRPGSFDNLLRILDKELRLITPTDPEGVGAGRDPDSDAGRNFYQLTHDFLVAPLRKWLNQKQRETARGRAELRLDERCATWTRTPENRFLPSLAEYANIRSLTRPSGWSENEHKLMRAADRFFLRRSLALVAILAAIAVVGWRAYASVHSESLVKNLLRAETVDAPAIIGEMTGWRSFVEPRLLSADVTGDPKKQLHVNLALAYLPDRRARLWDQLLAEAQPAAIPFIADTITPTPDELNRLWQALRKPGNPATDLGRLRAGAALAHWEPGDVQWQDVSFNLAGSLLNQDSFSVWKWSEAFAPVHKQLSRALVQHLTDYRYDQADELHNPGLIVALIGECAGESREFPDFLESLLAEYDYGAQSGRDPATDVVQYDGLSQKQANMAAALAGLGQWQPVLPLLDSARNERTRALLIEQFARFGVEPESLTREIDRQTNPDVRAALWLSLGGYLAGEEPVSQSDSWLMRAQAEFTRHPDARVHAAVEWLIRKMGHAEWIDQFLAETALPDYPAGQTWRITSQRHTMVRIAAPGAFVMSFQRPALVDYDFEVSAMEINIGQFLRFDSTLEDFLFGAGNVAIPSANEIPDVHDYPATGMTWLLAAEYCNWLSRQEGIPEDQWCYEPHPDPVPDLIRRAHDDQPALRLVHDYRNRTGFRLPLESEWDYLAGFAVENPLHSKSFEQVFGNYEWFGFNMDGDDKLRRGGRKKPNPNGLFDLFGNVQEYCSDHYGSTDDLLEGTFPVQPGSDYLQPVDFESKYPESRRNDSPKLAKGVALYSRDVDDHRGTPVMPLVGSAPYAGFRVVRILPQEKN